MTDCVLCAMCEQESMWLTVYCVQCVSRNQCGGGEVGHSTAVGSAPRPLPLCHGSPGRLFCTH